MKFNVKRDIEYKSGIYIITNSVDERVYIGQTVNFYKRWLSHRHKLETGDHFNTLLQDFVNDNSLDALEFRVLESNNKNLDKREAHYILKFKSICKGYGFNLSRCGVSLREFNNGYVLNSSYLLSRAKKFKYEIARLEFMVEEYQEHFVNIAASNCGMADEMEELRDEMLGYKIQCKEMAEELALKQLEIEAYSMKASKSNSLQKKRILHPVSQLNLFTQSLSTEYLLL